MISWFSESFREKIVFLAGGTVVTVCTVAITLTLSQYTLKADYNKDEMKRLEILTTVKLQQAYVQQELIALNKKIDRMNDKIDKLGENRK